MAGRADGAGCVFCGGTEDMTKEHVFGDWMAGVMREPAKLLVSRIYEAEGRVESWKDAAFNQRVRDVCDDCNHGWMSDLENAAKPTLARMMLGQTVELSELDQATAAFWAVKTALVLQHVHGKGLQAVPSEIFHRFYEEQRPPPFAQVWIARYVGQSYATHYHHRAQRLELEGVPGSPEDPNAYLATFGVGQLVLQVFDHFLEEDVTLIARSSVYKGLRRIWPSRGAVLWPGPFVFNEAGIRALANRLDSGGVVIQPVTHEES